MSDELTIDLPKELCALRQPLRNRLDALLAHLANHREGSRLYVHPSARDEQEREAADPVMILGTPLDEVAIRTDARNWSTDALEQLLTPTMTTEEALVFVERNAGHLIDATLLGIEQYAQHLVKPEFHRAAVDRVVTSWPWPLQIPQGALLHLLIAHTSAFPSNEPLLAAWPADAAMATIAKWASTFLDTFQHKGSWQTMTQPLRSRPLLYELEAPPFAGAHLPTTALAHLYLAEQQAIDDQKKAFIAIDASRENHELVSDWRDMPKNKHKKQKAIKRQGRLELILDDRKKPRYIQLMLDLEHISITEQVSHALREFRGWAGLRHWVAFQSLLTQNNRLGEIVWSVDAHLAEMGYNRHRPELKETALAMVDMFTRIELAVYNPDGTLRERRPLLLVAGKVERKHETDAGTEWLLEGYRLFINPTLYRGVRELREGKRGRGKLGKNWYPAPRELAQVDHGKFGPAIALGLVLPIRWRLEYAQSGKRYVRLKGTNLLRAAGIPFKAADASYSFGMLERNLAHLVAIGGLEGWEWTAAGPHTHAMCSLYAPQWTVDRLAHGVRPKLPNPVVEPLTGKDLKEWREKEKISQAKAADLLGITSKTVKRAEVSPKKPLSKRIGAAFQKASQGDKNRHLSGEKGTKIATSRGKKGQKSPPLVESTPKNQNGYEQLELPKTLHLGSP